MVVAICVTMMMPKRAKESDNLTEQVSGKEHDDHEDVSRIDNEVEFLLRAAYTY